ncbi:hypothetical protein GGF32_003778 [Allomyces javanicus]|nr:hypothetical protein GGF32_003778 [Allomyces javanicus]
MVSRFTDAAWTFLATVTKLDLSQNDLTTADLKFLMPRIPPKLQLLNLASNKFHTLITPFPPTLRVLDISENVALSDDIDPARWIDELPRSLCTLIVNNCHLDGEVGRLLVETLTSLSLSQCLPSRVVSQFTDASWAFLTTVMRLDLSQNGLATADLKFLALRLPLNLQVLNFAGNKFHVLVMLFPLTLRMLNILNNVNLSDDIDPARWIDAFPRSLCKLIVHNCHFNDDVGQLLVAAQWHAGKTWAGAPNADNWALVSHFVD